VQALAAYLKMAQEVGPQGDRQMGQDNLDSNFGRLGISDTGINVRNVASAAVSYSGDTYCYDMNHRQRGNFIIVNNKTFNQNTGMGARTGTDVDAGNLKKMFTDLGFKVDLKHNQTVNQMHGLMIAEGKRDHKDEDCVGVAILSHGDQGILYGIDGTIEIDKLVEPFKMCPSLAGKPKLFFFQACRGTELDHGVETSDADADPPRDKIARIPMEADFLYAYSTTPGYFSWRNSNKGSWFVQALYLQMTAPENKSLDLCRILTRVNYSVAYDFESNASQPHMNKKKQVPSVVSMLTKDLYFPTKK